MCRILFLKWTNNKKAEEYIDAIREAGKNDPHLAGVVKILWLDNIPDKHKFGWGYLLVTKDNIINYKSWKAFYKDNITFNKLKEELNEIKWEFLLMLELRHTDIGYISAMNSHPFFFASNNGYEGYLFYNGLLDYESLAKKENIDFKNYKRKNGTTIMWLSIAKELSNWFSLKNAIQAPKTELKSGYNLMVFVNDNTWKYKAIVNAFAKEELMKQKGSKDYYTLIKKDDKDLFFVWSAAIWVYKKDNYEEMKNWEIIEFDIDFINEDYFTCYEL